MSRPLNSLLQLRVGAERVEATLSAGWPRRAAALHAQREVDVSAAGDSELDAHAQAIDAVLADIAAQRSLKGVRLEAQLSSALVHLDVVEGAFADQADRQLQAVASACMDEMLGDDAAAHELRWHLQRDARHLLIAAIPRAHLALLQAVAQRTGLRLRSVTPEFVVRWNQFGRVATRGHWVFAVSTGDDLAIATVADGAVSSISLGPGIELEDVAAVDAPPAPVRPVYLKSAAPLMVKSSLGGGHGVFTSTRPMPQAGGDALDARVDRLLVGCGQDPEAQARFLLVACAAHSFTPSSRWALAGSEVAA